MKKVINLFFTAIAILFFTFQLTGQVIQETFVFTGATEQFTVPTGVTNLTIQGVGASGGNSTSNSGGLGAQITAEFSVTPGEVITLLVGENGEDELNNGAGGGGGSYIVRAGNIPLVIAGGGGGSVNAGNNSVNGGDAFTNANSFCLGGGGAGAGGVAPGAGGGGTTGNGGATGNATGGSSFLNGSSGGDGGDGGDGGFGGGGGGYLGGGGGGGCSGGGGGFTSSSTNASVGGSSYVDASAMNSNFILSATPGNGQIIISYAAPAGVVPTLSQWGIIILSLLILIFGAVAIRKRVYTVVKN